MAVDFLAVDFLAADLVADLFVAGVCGGLGSGSLTGAARPNPGSRKPEHARCRLGHLGERGEAGAEVDHRPHELGRVDLQRGHLLGDLVGGLHRASDLGDQHPHRLLELVQHPIDARRRLVEVLHRGVEVLDATHELVRRVSELFDRSDRRRDRDGDEVDDLAEWVERGLVVGHVSDGSAATVGSRSFVTDR